MEKTQPPWFEANSQLLQREVDALAALNIEFTINSALQRQGILQLSLVIDPTNPAFTLPAGQDPIQLEALFPHNYPYFRPEIKGLNVTLPRHQDPFGKYLCMLPRASKHWNVEWTLGDLIQAQLPKVLEKGEIVDADLLAADPTEQAEPVSNYYGTTQYPIIFNSAGFDAFKTTEANVSILGRIQVGLAKQRIVPARMAVLEGTTVDKQVVSQLPAIFQEMFPVRFEGYALRLAERPPYGEAWQDLKWLKGLLAQHHNGIVPQSKPLSGLKGSMAKEGVTITQIWALNFPEEVKPGLFGRGWLFLIEGLVESSVLQGKRPVKGKDPFAYYARIARSGPEDVQIRVPTLTQLPEHTIAIVGLGALGAPAAIEFARNQVGALRLMDFDPVDPATTVRWPLGAMAYGQPKTDALQAFIHAQYPRTAVRILGRKIGSMPVAGEPTESQVLDELLNGASLLFDATAETGVNHFLSQEAKKRGIPYISLYATPGGWGGLVMRVVPGKTAGCWMCLQYAKDRTIPIPRSDVAGQVQAPSCGDLTFTGASFDLQNVSLAGVRLAVSTLCGGLVGGYPDVRWDVQVLSTVDDDDQPIPPTWQTFPLEVDPQCPYCSMSCLHA